nr:MAG TPA: hypothetical protein [Caudoviricetes sp.]
MAIKFGFGSDGQKDLYLVLLKKFILLDQNYGPS